MGKKEVLCDCDIIHTPLVEKAKGSVTGKKDLHEMASLFKAVADSTRISILDLLKNIELCVCDISVIMNMTKSAISHQLKYLKNKNLIKSRKSGREVWYSLADEHIRDLLSISFEHIKEV